MTPAEFEAIAEKLAMAEDWLRDTIALARIETTTRARVVEALEDSYRIVIAAHAQAQLLAGEGDPEPFDWPSCPLCGRPLNVCHREGCSALKVTP